MSEYSGIGNVPQEIALRNNVILRTMFTMLNQRDLESCSNVGGIWRSVAKPMVTSNFDVEVVSVSPRDDSSNTRVIYVIKKYSRYSRYCRKRFSNYEMDFNEISKKLSHILLNHRISINLTIRVKAECAYYTLQAFLTEFGSFVVVLAFKLPYSLHVNAFYENWLKRLPNLEKLYCSDLTLTQENLEFDNFNADQFEYRNQKQRIISCRNICMNIRPFLTLLKINPNLKEILELPIHLVWAVAANGFGSLLKSVDKFYSDIILDTWQATKSAFEELACSRASLTSFSMPEARFYLGSPNSSYIMNLVYSILQSSAQSLKSLSLEPIEPLEVHSLPPLTGVRSLEFHNGNGGGGKVFFSTTMEFSLEELYPNIRKVCIWFYLTDEVISHCFPGHVIIPWGYKVKVLTLRDVEYSTLSLVQKRFPSVEKLKLRVTTGELAELLALLPQLWPDLKSLSLNLRHGYIPVPTPDSSAPSDNYMPISLDSAFNGLPEDTVNILLDPMLRKTFVAEDVQRFKKWSLIGQLKELNELKLIYENCKVVGVSIEQQTRLSHVASEFGFQLLPRLIDTLKIRKFSDENNRNSLKTHWLSTMG